MTSPNGHIGIVIHDTISGGSFKGVVKYCKGKWSKPAYNEICGRNGEHEVLTWGTSYNAGKINKRQFIRLTKGHRLMKKPPPDSTIYKNNKLWGFAFNRKYKEPITKLQWDKAVEVLEWRCYKWGLNPMRHITGHKTLTARKNDPWNYGDIKVLEKLKKDVNKRLKERLNNGKTNTKKGNVGTNYLGSSGSGTYCPTCNRD